MATTNPLSDLLGDATGIAQALASPAALLTFVRKETAALNSTTVKNTDLWPVSALGKADRLLIPGDPQIEAAFHKPLEQGRMFESGSGEATAWIQKRKLSLEKEIIHYTSLNQIAIDAKLTDVPRAIKLAKDSVDIIEKIRTFLSDVLLTVAALNATVTLMTATEQRMVAFIDRNIGALQTLLNEICNWRLPSLPSMASLLGSNFHWSGFNFNLATGFMFPSSILQPNLNFTFNQCKLLVGDFEDLFNTPIVVAEGVLPVAIGPNPLPASGIYADSNLLTTPAYIALMQATTTTPVFSPLAAPRAIATSLPYPTAIVSAYSLPAATYVANVVSTLPLLQPVVIQMEDADYTLGTPSLIRQANLRSLLRYVTLDQIVASGYEPNLTAAWLLYLDANHQGRAGAWLASFQEAYAQWITPSITYLTTTPVPWNMVLGGAGLSDGPSAIPLIADLKADTTNLLHWRLSYIEASLLGLQRNTTWDASADSIYLGGPTGQDLDYVATSINTALTASMILGVDRASLPVTCSYPAAIASVLAEVIARATIQIANTPAYQSTRPQFRFTYNIFAEAQLVDRYTQFWREFNANLQALLAREVYLTDFAVTYVDTLDGAINPLAKPAAYAALEADAASRNRAWTPGSSLLPIPKALSTTDVSSPVTDQNNGMVNGVFSAAAYLARPDIQAQSLPVQLAMLRTTQSIMALTALKANVQSAFATATASAQASIDSQNLFGWDVDSSATQIIAPGSSGALISLDTVGFDQSGNVTDMETITVRTAGSYMLSSGLLWADGDAGTRTLNLLLNGHILDTASSTPTTGEPFNPQVSLQADLAAGDVLQIQAVHSLSTNQMVLSGSFFLGIASVATN